MGPSASTSIAVCANVTFKLGGVTVRHCVLGSEIGPTVVLPATPIAVKVPVMLSHNQLEVGREHEDGLTIRED